MKYFIPMVSELIKRVVESYKTLVLDKSKHSSFLIKIVLITSGVICYPFLAIVLAAIILIAALVVIPASFISRRL